MANEWGQLHFDISEKVRLQPQLPGVDQLLALDLYPDVEIEDHEKHLTVHGYLRLDGNYIGEGGTDQEVISFVIPVEITLPRERAVLDSISAEIQNFDYQVLSPFELQIDAILCIDGILPDHQQNQTHAFSASAIEEDAYRDNDYNEELALPETEERYIEEQGTAEIEENTEQETINEIEAKKEQDKASEVVEENYEQHQVKEIVTKKKEQEETDTIQPEEEIVMEVVDDDTPLEAVDEEEVAADDHPEPQTKWLQWLVKEDQERFIPLRLVIVQKEDSIQSLAEKYQLNTHEIYDLNKLQSDQLDEGQILYLPRRDGEEGNTGGENSRVRQSI